MKDNHINDDKSFNRALVTIRGQSEKLAILIHATALFAIAQVNEHGNDGFAVRLVDAMGKKNRAEAVKAWLVHFGKLKVSKGVLSYSKRKDINATNLDKWLEKADATPYWKLTPEPKLRETKNYLTALNNLLKYHDKTANEKREAGIEVTELNTPLIDHIRKLVEAATPKPATQA